MATLRAQDLIKNTRFMLAGNKLKTTITDDDILQAVDIALSIIDRYWYETTFVTMPFKSCIDFGEFGKEHVSYVAHIYRATGTGDFISDTPQFSDPFYAQQYIICGLGGNMENIQDYVYDLAAWNTMNQIRNTVSSNLSFIEDTHGGKVYINQRLTGADKITIEFVPRLHSIDQIKSPYWQDQLRKLTLALCKIAEGRIRSRYKSTAAWEQDGDKILEEGNTELKEIEDKLMENCGTCDPVN